MRTFVFVILLAILTGCSQPSVSVQTKTASDQKSSIKKQSTKGQAAPAPKSKKYVLYVSTTPKARVRIMNIRPKYHDGILLKKGRYRIVVDKKGYRRYDRWIKLSGDTKLHVTLKALPKKGTATQKRVPKRVEARRSPVIEWYSHNEPFSLVYDRKNVLVWALPSAYVDYVRRNHPHRVLKESVVTRRKGHLYEIESVKLDTIVYTGYFRDDHAKRERFSQNSSMHIYYASTKGRESTHHDFGSLAELRINGFYTGWRLPSFYEIMHNNPFAPYQRFFEIVDRSSGTEKRYNLPVLFVGKRHFKQQEGFGLCYEYNPKSKLYNGAVLTEFSAKNRLEKLGLGYNLLYSQKLLLPVRKANRPYDDIIYRSPMKLAKKLEHIAAQMQRAYFKEYPHLQSKEHKEEVAHVMREQAMRMLCGDVKLSLLRYDETAKRLIGHWYASSCELEHSFSLPMKRSKAMRLLKEMRNPQRALMVRLKIDKNAKLQFLSLDMLSKRQRIKKGFEAAKVLDTKEAYSEFMREYPGNIYAKEAQKLLSKCQTLKKD